MNEKQGRGSPESSWLAARRCLAVINRLQQGAATKRDLITAVYHPLDPQASLSALSKRFGHDKRPFLNLYSIQFRR